jgi:hypothetical protein
MKSQGYSKIHTNLFTTLILIALLAFLFGSPAFIRKVHAISASSISGQVKDGNGNAVSGAIISDGAGQTASTDSNGDYSLSELNAGTYTITPTAGGCTFSPAARTVTVPPDIAGQDFIATMSCTNIPDGLVGLWKGDGNGLDAIGNNNVTPYNGASYAPGIVNQSFSLDGIGAYVNIPDSTSLDPTGSFTLEGWIFPTWPAADNSVRVIMSKWGSGNTEWLRSYSLAAIGLKIQFAISDAAHEFDGSFHNFTTSNDVLTVNQWNHVAATYNQSSGTRTIFVNGELIDSRQDAPITVSPSGGNATFGATRDRTGICCFFQGQIDEFGFYKRALDLSEIQQDYQDGLNGRSFCEQPPADVTSPIILPIITGTLGKSDWYTSSVTVAWNISDPESGIASSSGCNPTTLTSDSPGEPLSCTATNGAGLSNSVSITVLIDTTAPSITWTGNINDKDMFYFGFVPAPPTCTASDNGSGVDGSCSVGGYSTAIGTHELTATVMDKAGNVASVTHEYQIMPWTLKGFYQPVDMNGVFNIAKGGSTIPLKFEVFAGPIELKDTADIKSFTYIPIVCSTNAEMDVLETTATGNAGLRYDSTAGQFINNWKTPKSSETCLRVTLTTVDSSTLVAYFKLK